MQIESMIVFSSLVMGLESTQANNSLKLETLRKSIPNQRSNRCQTWVATGHERNTWSTSSRERPQEGQRIESRSIPFKYKHYWTRIRSNRTRKMNTLTLIDIFRFHLVEERVVGSLTSSIFRLRELIVNTPEGSKCQTHLSGEVPKCTFSRMDNKSSNYCLSAPPLIGRCHVKLQPLEDHNSLMNKSWQVDKAKV